MAVPYRSFSPAFFNHNDNAVLPLDLSNELNCSGPATGPSLCANFVRIDQAELFTSAVATSQLFFVADSDGETLACDEQFSWTKGDMLVLPAGGDAIHSCSGKAALYWVHDAPLLHHLGNARHSSCRAEPEAPSPPVDRHGFRRGLQARVLHPDRD